MELETIVRTGVKYKPSANLSLREATDVKTFLRYCHS